MTVYIALHLAYMKCYRLTQSNYMLLSDVLSPTQPLVLLSLAKTGQSVLTMASIKACFTLYTRWLVHQLSGQFLVQVLFHIFEDAELKPLLDAVNDEREKEKQKEAEG